jgi:hypothetical protein
MASPQSGIFALGTASHAYLEFDRRSEPTASDLVRAIVSLREPRTTMGGVNLVAGSGLSSGPRSCPTICLAASPGSTRTRSGPVRKIRADGLHVAHQPNSDSSLRTNLRPFVGRHAVQTVTAVQGQ